jgi:class 3 adenylate cyclase
MFKVGIGQSDEINTLLATRNAIARARHSLGDSIPQAGMVFAGLDFDHELMLAEINRVFPDLELVGCTSGGELTSDLGFTDDSIVLLLLYSAEVKFSVGLGFDESMESELAATLALDMARQSLSEPEKLCLVFTDSFSLSGNRVIEKLNSSVTSGCKIFGGVSARPFVTNLKTKQFYKNQVLSESVVLMLMGGPIEYRFSISNTWQPIGRKAKATLVDGKKLLQIDDMRALDYYHYYLGDFSFPAPEFPLAVYENGSEHFYIRVPGGYDKKDGSVLFAGEIPEGATVQLTEALREYIVDGLDKESIRQKEMKYDFEPAMAFAFSCIVRKQLLGTKVKEEIKVLKKNLPASLPIFGFYTYGEISPLEAENRSNLHNCTMITLVLGTKSKNDSNKNSDIGIGNTNTVKGNSPVGNTREYSLQKNSLQDIIEEQKNEILKLKKKLDREYTYRINLENVKDFHSSILKTINNEIESAKQVIQLKNDELEKLYKELGAEKKKSDDLLLNILPIEVAEELKRKGLIDPVYYDSASVLFTDFKGFTTIASKMKPSELVRELDFYFSEFDKIIERYGLEKLKTIGDAYMCAGGLPKVSTTHAVDLVNAAWDIQEFMKELKLERGDSAWDLRIGINSGPLMAGVIGTKKFSYDIWGDTVNIASRLESNGEPKKINISQFTYDLVKEDFLCEYRGKISVKNKGEIDMYFVSGKKNK